MAATARRRRASWVLVVLSATGSGAAAELSGAVTATSEYIYRGLAVSDGDPALQFELDVEFDSGFFGGLWASTVDIESPFSRRDRELDLYLGYHFEPAERVGFTGTLIRYTYPGQRGFDYDYSEALAAVTLDGRYSIEFGYSDDLYGRGGTGRHWELRADWPLASAWVLSAGLGHNDLTDYRGTRYLHGDIGASARLGRLLLDLRWYDNEPVGSRIGGASAGSRLVVSLSGVF